MQSDKDIYIECVRDEITKLAPRFTGNIDFKFNFKDGGIANINISLSKSVKLSEN